MIFSIVLMINSKIYQTLIKPWIKEKDVEQLFTDLYNNWKNTLATKDRIQNKFISDGIIKVYKDDSFTKLDYWILQECKLNTFLGDKEKIAAQFLQSLVYISFSLYDISYDLPGDKCKGIVLNSKYFFGYIDLKDIDLSSWEPLWDKYRKIVRPCDAFKHSELLTWAKQNLKFTKYFDIEQFKTIDDSENTGLLTNINNIRYEIA